MMSASNVIFAGGGHQCSTLMMWPSPDTAAKPVVVSQFEPGYSIYALAISPNGTRIAAGTSVADGSGLGLLRVHALADFCVGENAPVLFDVHHPPAVFSLAFCTDDILASGGHDGHIKLWSLTEGSQVGEIAAHENGVFALRQLGSLVLASIGGDGVLRIWDMDTLEAKYESEPFKLPRTHALTCLDYCPSSGLLLHPSRNGDIHVYDVHNDFEHRIIPAHHGDFAALACSSEHIVTAGIDDTMIKVWSASLDERIAETSVSAGVLAVGWAGMDTVLAACANGCGQFRLVDAVKLVPGDGFTDLGLRSIAGLPAELLDRCVTSANRQWRDQKLAEAKQLMDQPEKQRQLAVVADKLRLRGFSAEAALILADGAKAQGKLLWELDSRLALVNGLGDSRAALPSLYALAVLLLRIKEPRLAQQYLEKIVQIDKQYRDVEKLIEQVRHDPLFQLHPEQDVHGDLLSNSQVSQELEKYTILEKKFLWRFVLEKGKVFQLTTHLDADEALDSVFEVLTTCNANINAVTLRHDLLLYEGELREVAWIYVPSGDTQPGIVFALEISFNTKGTVLIPYKIFDPRLSNIVTSATPVEHNQQVKDAWLGYVHSSAAEQWFLDVCRLAIKDLRQLGGKVLARKGKK